MLIRTSLATLFAATLLCTSSSAQTYKADHRFAYATVLLENSSVRVEMDDVVSEITYCKFRFKVTNKTGDYLFVDPTKFKVTMGTGALGFKEKAYMVRPYEKESKTLNVTGGTDYHVDAFSIDFADGFKVLPVKGQVAAMEAGSLPPANNQITGGPFTVELLSREQQTARTEAKYKVKYGGTAMAIVDPSKISVKIPAGQQFANVKSKSKSMVLTPGGEEDFLVIAEIPGKIADMQFTTLTVEWGESMVESMQQPLAVDAARFAVDAAKTAALNK